jgi:uncharacterized protein YndB with AHSA1/START domain
MAVPVEIQPEDPRELAIARRMAAPAMALYRCWTDPALIPRWFAPAPLTTEVKVMDVRPGGVSRLTMRSPDGQEFPGDGVYLAVEPGKRIVFTDAYTEGWKPTENPMFTGEITFEDLGDGECLYVARARHWTPEACEQHKQMGFHEGWGLCAEQLEAVAKTLT